MYDYHFLLGSLALIVGLIGYIPYYRDIFRGKTIPHPFTYFVGGVLGAIIFAAQIAEGAGPGAWVTLIPVVTGFSIAAIGWFHHEREIVPFDWVCLAAALVAIIVWRLTDDPLQVVILAILVNGIALIPTFRKGYRKPHQETAASYGLGALRSIIAMPALVSVNTVTLLPLVFHAAVNISLVAMLLIRRRISKS